MSGVFTLEGIAFRFLGRFDQDAVEFVAKFPHWCNLNAGAFDNTGDFYTSCDSTIYLVQRPDLSVGYTSAVKVTAEASRFIIGSDTAVSDLTTLQHDLTGNGTTQNWLVGLAHAGGVGRLVLVSIEDRMWYKIALDGFEYGHGWGAAWNHRPTLEAPNKIYFSANNGAGVFELVLSSLDLSKSGTDDPGATLVHTGLASAVTPNNDGLYCNPLSLADSSLGGDGTTGDGTGTGGGDGGVPFWVFYVLIAVIGALCCCCLVLAWCFAKRNRREMHEFELADTGDHIHEVSALHQRSRGNSML